MKTNKSYLFDIFSVVGFIYVIVISFFIYARIDENGALINGVFSTEVNFKGINASIDAFFNRLFHFGSTPSDDEVSGSVTYLELGEHRFKMEDQKILVLDAGMVTYATTENEKYVIVVNYREYQAIYRNLNSASVAAMDHLQSGDVIGEYEEYFICHFFKDNKEIEFSQIQSAV